MRGPGVLDFITFTIDLSPYLVMKNKSVGIFEFCVI